MHFFFVQFAVVERGAVGCMSMSMCMSMRLCVCVYVYVSMINEKKKKEEQNAESQSLTQSISVNQSITSPEWPLLPNETRQRASPSSKRVSFFIIYGDSL